MKNYFLYSVLLIVLILLPALSTAQTAIDVSVQGISDGAKNSKQQDRDEAILDAKLKAIERAGVSVEAVTTMENFKLKKDWVESKASAVILPGFQVIDVGYGADGLYHVVLVGKVSSEVSIEPEDSGSGRKLRMAKLYLESDRMKALRMFKDIADNDEDCAEADDALYYLICESTYNTMDANYQLIKLKSFYPDSPHISQAESYVARKDTEKRQEALNSMTFATIPAGSFQMGSNESENEKPVHTVSIKSFQMQTAEVTQAQWKTVMGRNPSEYNYLVDSFPVEKVSWHDCQEFIKKLNLADPGKGYRLPTEAEWEYACRAGTTTKFFSGNNDKDLWRVGWAYGNSHAYVPHSVGQKEPNNWGLHDMHGNINEWCEDWYHDSYNGAPTDGSAWMSPPGSQKVLRGGYWMANPENCSSAKRHRYKPDTHEKRNGFRLVRDVSK